MAGFVELVRVKPGKTVTPGSCFKFGGYRWRWPLFSTDDLRNKRLGNANEACNFSLGPFHAGRI